MDSQTQPPSPKGAAGASAADARALLVAGVLLVVIVAALAVLWVRERRGRMDAQREIARLRAQVRVTMQQVALETQLSAWAAASRWIQKQQLLETVELQGRRRAVFAIDAADGERLGFRGGEVIFVSPRSATQSAPAE